MLHASVLSVRFLPFPRYEERFSSRTALGGAEVLSAQADRLVSQNHPGRKKRAGANAGEKSRPAPFEMTVGEGSAVMSELKLRPPKRGTWRLQRQDGDVKSPLQGTRQDGPLKGAVTKPKRPTKARAKAHSQESVCHKGRRFLLIARRDKRARGRKKIKGASAVRLLAPS